MDKKIIIVEDDPDLLFLLQIVLTKAGYKVQGLNGGSGIINQIYEWPDLFILDKEMEVIDGIAICKYLKLNNETKQIPVVMISGAIEQESKAMQAGVTSFLKKPLKIDELLKIIQTLISNSKAKVDSI